MPLNGLNPCLDVKTHKSVTTGVHLWTILMKTYRAMHARAVASIEDTGLCFSDFAVLEVLLNKGPLPVNTIAAKVGLTSGSGTTAIDRLERRELVVRRDRKDDRRARVVHLTAAGRQMISGAFAKHAEDMERAGEGLNAEERDQLAVLLRKLGKGVAE